MLKIIHTNISDLQEDLAKLYFRLNGFFTSSFIAHGPTSKHNLKGEIEIIAIRHPRHLEDEIENEFDDKLFLHEKKIDCRIVEVKNTPSRFNGSIYNLKNGVLIPSLKRTGLFDPKDVSSIAYHIYKSIEHDESSLNSYTINLDKFGIYGNIALKLMLIPFSNCQIEDYPINGNSIFNFCVSRLNRKKHHPNCSAKYGLELWDANFYPIVDYIKNSKDTPLAIDGLYLEKIVKQ